MSTGTTSFEEIQAHGEELRQYLAAQGITLHSESALAHALEGVQEAVHYWKARLLATSGEEQRLVRDLATVEALAAVVETAKRSAPDPALTKHLGALAGGDPHITSEGTQSGDRDALFELLAWHLCRQFASDVQFAEPDVCCKYRSYRFGLACKAHYGQTDRAATAIRKGWKQIRGAPVDYGFVVVHLTNHFPHAKMVLRAGGRIVTLRDEDDVSALFERNLQSVSRPIDEAFRKHVKLNPRPLDNQFQGVMYAAHSLPHFRDTVYRMGRIAFLRMQRDTPPEAWAFVQNFNRFWQDLSGMDTTALA